jgi:hypothetical protein
MGHTKIFFFNSDFFLYIVVIKISFGIYIIYKIEHDTDCIDLNEQYII